MGDESILNQLISRHGPIRHAIYAARALAISRWLRRCAVAVSFGVLLDGAGGPWWLAWSWGQPLRFVALHYDTWLASSGKGGERTRPGASAC